MEEERRIGLEIWLGKWRLHLAILREQTETLLIEGSKLLKNEQYEEAMSKFQEALILNPTYLGTSYCIVHLLRKQKKYEEALERLNVNIKLEPKKSRSYQILGFIYSDLRKFEDAIGAFKKAISLKPRDSLSRYGLGNVYFDSEKFEKAIKQYRISIDEDIETENYPITYVNIGNAMIMLERYEEAKQQFMSALIYDTNYHLAYEGLGRIYYRLNEFEEALKQYLLVVKSKPNFSYGYQSVGNTLNRLKRYDEAILCFKQAIQLDPDDADNYCCYGRTLNALEKYEEEIAQYAIAISLAPNCTDYYNYTGYALRSLNRHDEAIAMFKKSIQISPLAETFIGLGNAFKDIKEYNEAIKQFKLGIEINPKLHNAYFNMGLTYLKMREYQQSKEIILERVREMKEVTAYTYYCQAILNYKLQNYIESIQLFQECFNHPPIGVLFKHSAHYYYGMALWKQSQSTKTDDYQTILEAFNVCILDKKNWGKGYYRRAQLNMSRSGHSSEDIKSDFLYAVEYNRKNPICFQLSEQKISAILELTQK